jgi:hypothetical protein
VKRIERNTKRQREIVRQQMLQPKAKRPRVRQCCRICKVMQEESTVFKDSKWQQVRDDADGQPETGLPVAVCDLNGLTKPVVNTDHDQN